MRRLGLVALALGLLGPPGAAAGTYTTWACHQSDGGPATFLATNGAINPDGWIYLGEDTSNFEAHCGSGEVGLDVRPLQDTDGAENVSKVRFTAPVDTRIAAWRFERTFRYPKGYDGHQRYEIDADGHTLTAWTLSGSEPTASQIEAYGGLAARSVTFGFRCVSTCPYYVDRSWPPKYPAITSAWHQLTLSDDIAPSVETVESPLVSSRELRGEVAVRVSATDRGSGIYRLVVLAGDDVVASPVIGVGDHCSDADPANLDPYEFRSTRPCAREAERSLTVDTTALPEGEQPFSLLVEDAAGNRMLAAGPWRAKVNNRFSPDDPLPASAPVEPTRQPPAALNGHGATIRALLRVAGPSRRGLDYGERGVVTATLANQAGEPIAGAELIVSERVALALAPWHTVGSVRTDDRGRARVPLAAGASRRIRITYAAALGGSEPDALAELDLVVRAGTSLNVDRRRVRNGDRVTFLGRLRGQPVPEKGVLLELQAWTGDRWQTFRSVRSNRSGKWRGRYRFRRTTRTVRYAFRAVVAEDSGYPYKRGVSRVIGVTVRP